MRLLIVPLFRSRRAVSDGGPFVGSLRFDLFHVFLERVWIEDGSSIDRVWNDDGSTMDRGWIDEG